MERLHSNEMRSMSERSVDTFSQEPIDGKKGTIAKLNETVDGVY